MSDTERLRQVAQREMQHFTNEAERCFNLADHYTTAAEMALKQIAGWQQYMEGLVVGAVTEVIPLPRVEGPHLTLLEGGA